MNIGFTTPTIACMAADTFTEQFLYLWNERVLGPQIKTGEGKIRRLETPRQRTRVVALWSRDLLLLDFARPETIDCQRLVYAERRKVRIGPCDCTVSVLFRVVAVPGWCPVIGFRSIVITFAMAAHVQELVLRVTRRFMIQFGDLVLESLPLGRIVNVKCLVAGIGAVEESEISGHEIER